VNSSACFGTTRTENSSPDRSAPGQLEALRGVRLLDIDHRGLRLAASLPQYLQGVSDHRVGLAASWSVVVSCHRCIPALPIVPVTGVADPWCRNRCCCTFPRGCRSVLLFTGCACTTHGEPFLCPAVDACQTIAWSAERLAEGTVVVVGSPRR